MDYIYVYLIKMPPGINESVEPCLDGYTIYLNQDLMGEDLTRAYDHAMKHIENGDFDCNITRSVSEMEWAAHR